ncbi:MAG TPA: hypothetical protein VJZ76_04745 [Thermoanaerobaculia bacterium]|nr:hypothetical protein [Thermoanaerobaculia bacterium]
MSATTPIELNASTIIERIERGAYPPEVLQTIAAGFLPLPQEDLVPVLAFLATGNDSEIANAARASLAEMPSRVVAGVAQDDGVPPQHLKYLAHATDDQGVLEALVRNRALPDDVVVQLAGICEPGLQEVIVINQARILRAPQILDALLSNPILSPEARRRAIETREEFFEKTAKPQPPVEVEQPVEDNEDEELPDLELSDDAIADLLAKAPDDDRPATIPSVPENDPNRSIFAKIMLMTTKEKVQLAFRCGKTERMILVRDRNKLICSAVMRNPRMTDTEVEGIATMRNVDDEVLRLIGTRRDWMAKTPIVVALVHNPKSPVGVVLPLINRLTLRDLKQLKDDKGVSEVVRMTARKLFLQRSQK